MNIHLSDQEDINAACEWFITHAGFKTCFQNNLFYFNIPSLLVLFLFKETFLNVLSTKSWPVNPHPHPHLGRSQQSVSRESVMQLPRHNTCQRSVKSAVWKPPEDPGPGFITPPQPRRDLDSSWQPATNKPRSGENSSSMFLFHHMVIKTLRTSLSFSFVELKMMEMANCVSAEHLICSAGLNAAAGWLSSTFLAGG